MTHCIHELKKGGNADFPSAALIKIKEMAIRDSLTGLYNRRYVREWFEKELTRCRRYQIAISCLLIDIDFFKNVNDTYGHQTGDVVLRQLSNLFAENSRSSDVVSRYGGEEFLVILTNTGVIEAKHTAKKILGLIQEEQMPVDDNQEIRITASIGVASIPGDNISDSATIDEIIQLADKNLYIAKGEGRNQIVW